MIYFVGAGSGAADLITVRGMRLLERADMVVWAGSLVNGELLSYCKPGC
ncbi:MAG: cobalt-precorrin-4 C(11)-methyltransferase, partial [Treponemataceae bacterium]|nr:cobalt-precorrin-4 C(11)-methyltransferase [Treponemataceae bacterium]